MWVLQTMTFGRRGERGGIEKLIAQAATLSYTIAFYLFCISKSHISIV